MRVSLGRRETGGPERGETAASGAAGGLSPSQRMGGAGPGGVLSFRRCGCSHEVSARWPPAAAGPGRRGTAGLGPEAPRRERGGGGSPDAAGPGVWGRPREGWGGGASRELVRPREGGAAPGTRIGGDPRGDEAPAAVVAGRSWVRAPLCRCDGVSGLWLPGGANPGTSRTPRSRENPTAARVSLVTVMRPSRRARGAKD